MSSKPKERAPTARDALAIVIGSGLRVRELRAGDRPHDPIERMHEADAERSVLDAVLQYIAVLERNSDRLLARTKRSVSIITLGTGRTTNVFVPCTTPGCKFRMRRGRERCVQCMMTQQHWKKAT